MRRALLASIIVLLLVPAPASAQQDCANTLVFATPGVTWQDVEKERPSEILRAIEDGAAATLAVRTNEPVTNYASGFLTIGTGSRANAVPPAGGPADSEDLSNAERKRTFISVAGAADGVQRLAVFDEIKERADEDGYGAMPGALASGLGEPVVAIGSSDLGMLPRTPYGHGRYALLSATDNTGSVYRSFTDQSMLEPSPEAPFGVRSDHDAIVEAVGASFEASCSVVVVDPGDLIRADMASALAGRELVEERNAAIAAADRLLGDLRTLLDDDDLLLIASPTSPLWDEQVHLGLAIAVGEDYEPGSTLRSASTNRTGVVTLPDIAPTILEHQGELRLPQMLGRSFRAEASPFSDRVEGFARFDREAVYMHYTNPGISTAFVIYQFALYALAIALLWSREGKPEQPRGSITALEIGGLTVAAFPLATYLSTPLQAHELGTPLYITLILAIDAALVALAWWLFDDVLDRLFLIVASTFGLLVLDQLIGGPLQLNAVWGIDPITAGRFDGLGNISFAILGTTGLLTGALLLRKFGGRNWAVYATAAVFVLTVIVDGAPNLGSDVGGVLALVPALGLSFVLLTDKRPSARTVLIVILGALVALGAFLAFDLSRPDDSQTHLARLYEDVRDRGPDAFTDVIFRKARANLRLFRRTIWTYLVPVALGLLAYLVLRPKGAWRKLAVREPKLRAALIGGMLVGVFGFAVNDSGIVVPAMALSYLVPLALVFHLTEVRET